MDVNITPENIPLDFVKSYLRVDHDFDDLEIEIAKASAYSYVKNYINQPDFVPMDIGLIIPILTLTAYFYENKSPQMKSTEKLDNIFSSILNMHRNNLV